MAGQSLVALPSAAIRLIGSGQVITSVFSVIKELVENSVDAGCTSLDIKLDDFGLEKIEVSDNGCGIKVEDVPFMAKRHYTSKLVSTEDLLSLETYGFRGEALASLCAVSNMTITTKTGSDDVSYVYSLDREGNVENKKPSHLGTGTTVTARNLFHNLPVRKQYYRASQKRKEDLRKIEDLLTAFGIIKPKLRITLRHNRDLIFQKTSVTDTKGALHSSLGRQISSQLLYREKSLTDSQGSVQIYFPKPGSDVKTMSRSTTDRTFIVVNDRPVHVAEFAKVLKQYYCNCHDCDVARYPVCYVCVKLPACDVDVNLDPNKTTVFLQHMNEVVICLEEILLEVYGPLENVPSWHYSDAPKKEGELGKEKAGLNEKISLNISGKETSNLKTAGDGVKNPQVTGVNNNKSKELKESEILPMQESNVVIPPKNQNNSPLPSFTLTFHQDQNDVSSKSSDSAELDTNNAVQGINPDNCNNKCVQNSDVIQNPPTNVAASSSELSLEDLSSQAFFKDLLDEDLALPSASEISLNSNKPPVDEGTSRAGNIDCNELLDLHKGKNANKDGNLSSEETANTSDHTPQYIDLTGDNSNNKAVADSVTAGSSWSRGNCFVEGKNLQPVQLLAPTSRQTPGKRPLSPSSKSVSECPPKQKKMSFKPTVRDQVATMASQSQAEKKKTTNTTKSLRKRLYHIEKRVACCMKDLKTVVMATETESSRSHFNKPTVIGQAKSCDAWFCGDGTKLCLVNVCRLEENVLYRKLMERHILPASPCQAPLSLDTRNIHESLWPTLEELATASRTSDTYFHIKDERLVANGFDIRCCQDFESKLKAELVGLCELIPAYNVSDLSEILEIIKKDPLSKLRDSRPTKITYYLQSEAVRMLQQNTNKKLSLDVQDLLDQLSDTRESALCMHHKPVFHDLFDLPDLQQLDDDDQTDKDNEGEC